MTEASHSSDAGDYPLAHEPRGNVTADMFVMNTNKKRLELYKYETQPTVNCLSPIEQHPEYSIVYILTYSYNCYCCCTDTVRCSCVVFSVKRRPFYPTILLLCTRRCCCLRVKTALPTLLMDIQQTHISLHVLIDSSGTI